MKRLLLPLLICLVAVAIIVGISYQAIVNQRSAVPVGGSDSSISTSSSSSDSSDVLATSNVSYSGIVEEMSQTGSSAPMTTYKLTLSDSSYVLLASTDVNLVLASYLGKHVDVRGTVQPSNQAGILLLRAEEVTVLDVASSSSPSPERCGGIAGLPCPSGFTCVDDPSDGCDPAKGGADCFGICVNGSSSSSTEDSSSSSSVPSSSSSSSSSKSTSQSSQASAPKSSSSSAESTASSSASTQSDAMNQQVITMAKQKYDPALWTQQYCTSHLAFCIPAHKNWYYKSFGATTSNLWHVEFGIESIDALNQGPIVLNLVSGTSASMDAQSGQIKTQGTDVIGFLDWNDNQHFELIADARLKDVVAYMLSKITPYTPPVQ
jgi:hypothetical protein